MMSRNLWVFARTRGYYAAWEAGAPPPPLAGFGRRIGAMIADTLVLALVGQLAARVLGPAAVRWTLDVGLSMLYFTGFWVTSGRTVGCRAFGVRVQSEAGDVLLSGRAATIRWALMILFQVLAALGCVSVGIGVWLVYRHQAAGIIATLPLIAIGLAGVLNYTSALQDVRRQTWYDKAAQTVVVRA